MPFPNDIPDYEWNQGNLQMWSDPRVTNQNSVQLLPLEAKALHVIGTLVQIFNSVGYLLYCGDKRPYANYYLYAYLLACTAIELIGRCRSGETSLSRSTLEIGLANIGITTIPVNINQNGVPTGYIYNTDQLVALRNLAAHGQGVASANRRSQDVLLHVELLDSFPSRLMEAYDRYCDDLFESSDTTARRMLAISAVEPVLYSHESGQVYKSPVAEAHKGIYQDGKQPS